MVLYECAYRVNEAILKERISWKKKLKYYWWRWL